MRTWDYNGFAVGSILALLKQICDPEIMDFLGKMIFEIGVGQQAPPIGVTFGGVSGVTRPSGRGLRACPYMGAAEVSFIFSPKP